VATGGEAGPAAWEVWTTFGSRLAGFPGVRPRGAIGWAARVVPGGVAAPDKPASGPPDASGAGDDEPEVRPVTDPGTRIGEANPWSNPGEAPEAINPLGR
jgi:hypothetical protein